MYHYHECEHVWDHWRPVEDDDCEDAWVINRHGVVVFSTHTRTCDRCYDCQFSYPGQDLRPEDEVDIQWAVAAFYQEPYVKDG